MQGKEIERRLTTILVADIEGHSRLMGLDEEAFIRARREHDEIRNEIVERYRGRIFKMNGDNFLAEFPSAVEAVRCAVHFQGASRSVNLSHPRDRQLRYRIGIHVGDITVEGTDLIGDGVNVAARLEGLAEIGGICVSAAVWEQIQGKLSIDHVDIGMQTLKNVPRQVHVYRLRVDPPNRQRRASDFIWFGVAVVVTLAAGALTWRLLPSSQSPRPTPEAIQPSSLRPEVKEAEHKQADQPVAPPPAAAFGANQKTVENVPPRSLPAWLPKNLTAPHDLPEVFFPVPSGGRWRYRVELFGSEPPLMHLVTRWVLNEKHGVKQETRGVLYKAERDNPKNKLIEMHVIGPAPKQGSLQYPKGYQLAIDRDDIGYFENTKDLFFAINTHQGQYDVTIVQTFDETSPNSPNAGPWGQRAHSGESLRPFFISQEPGIGIGFSDDHDQLVSLGSVENGRCVYFARAVAQATPAEDRDVNHEKYERMDKEFQEFSYFCKGVGLEKLEQLVDGKLTMRWTLQK